MCLLPMSSGLLDLSRYTLYGQYKRQVRERVEFRYSLPYRQRYWHYCPCGLCCSASERIAPVQCPSADALSPPLNGVPCGMLAIVMTSNRRHHREQLARSRCTLINRNSDAFGNARPQYQVMDGLSHRCEAIALPPCPERDIQRVTSKVGMQPGSQFGYIFSCSIALLLLGSHCLYPWNIWRRFPCERHPRYAC